MLFPKPNRKAEKRAQKYLDRLEREEFRRAVVMRDRKCMNPWCNNRFRGLRSALEAHHIKYRSRGGSNNPGNGITFCNQCHEPKAHQGCKHPETGKRISGRQFVRLCMERHHERGHDVWDGEAWDSLKGATL